MTVFGTLGLISVLLSAATMGTWMVTQSAPTAALTCHPAYPDFCIPPSPPDVNCSDLAQNNFRAFRPDPHDLDEDDDGVACEDATKPLHPAAPALGFRVFAPMVACQDCVTAPLPTATPSSSPSTTSMAAPSATATATPTTAPTVATCGAASATITALDKGGESVTISGSGLLAGWYVISESGNQRFDFPAGYVLNGSVILDSGPGAINNPPGTLLWTNALIWNNSDDDDAFLYDCLGALRSSFEDGD